MKLSALPIMQEYGFSALTIAIVIGILLGNIVPVQYVMMFSEGLQFSKARLLRIGIVLYGFRITLLQLVSVGWVALLVDGLVVASTFSLAMMLRKRFHLEDNTAALIGSGSAICGAAAVLATQPVLKAKESDISVSVATVVVFGTLAMFAYPIMARVILPSDASGMAWFGWGIYTGATVHEVAQVAAAGSAVNATVADVAVISKMVRVMLLAPFLLMLPWLMKRFGAVSMQANEGIVIPWFAFGFLVMVGVNSFLSLSPDVSRMIIDLDTFLLTAAMFALGMTTRWQSVKQAGVKPLLLAGILMIWLVVGGGVISYVACQFLS
ncbi:YeiH family protein [Neisseria chenwenguii]|nr:YeiH family protein [Neisseria chenwenguii]